MPDPQPVGLSATSDQATLDELYGFFVVAMQRTGDTKEALRQTLLRGQPGLTSPEDGQADASVEPVPPASRFVSRAGARLGNWNDRRCPHDTRSAASLRWRLIDAFCGWLCVKGDPK